MGKEIKGGWWKEDMTRPAIHQPCLLLLIWSANAHIHEVLTAFSTRQHTCIATEEEQKRSGSEWETLTTENKFLNEYALNYRGCPHLHLSPVKHLYYLKKKKKLPLKRNERTAAGWFQTLWFKKNLQWKTLFLPFVKDGSLFKEKNVLD